MPTASSPVTSKTPVVVLGLMAICLGAGVGLGEAPKTILVLLALLVVVSLWRSPIVFFLAWLSLMILVPDRAFSQLEYWIVFRLYPAMIAILATLHRLARGKALPRWSTADTFAVGYLVAAVFSIASASDNPAGALAKLYDRAFVPIMVYGLARMTDYRGEWRRLVVPFVSILLVAEVWLALWFKLAPATFPSMWIPRPGVAGRAIGSMGNPNAFSTVVMFCVALLLHTVLRERRAGMRIGLWVLVGLGMFVVFLSLSRASWLALLIFSIVLGANYFRAITPALLALFLFAAFLLTSFYASEVSLAEQRLGNIHNVERRLIQIQAALGMFRSKPLLGWGYETYDQHDWRFVDTVGDSDPIGYDYTRATSHNTWLTILAETGLLGLFSYLFPFVWWFRKSRLSGPGSDSKSYFGGDFVFLVWMAILFYFTVTQFMDMRFFPLPTILIWLGLGMIAQLVERPPGDEEDPVRSSLATTMG